MKIRNFFSALTLIVLSLITFSCTKTEEAADVITPVETTTPTIPDGNRIIIHFGTSTQRGCMYSFSNCIWIGWGTELLNSQNRPGLQFDNGDDAGQYFGQYFPLTDDFTIDAATAHELGIEEQVIPAGFYALRDAASGQATGKRIVQFGPEFSRPVARLVNPENPQDNIGQLHNLAVQVILHDNKDAIAALNGDKKAIQKLLTEKMIAFMAEAELPVSAAEQKSLFALHLDRDYGNYAARLDETRLSANDKKTLLAIFDEAAAIPVTSPEELGKFVRIITEHENQLAASASLDNPKVVLSMLSVLKYSRYFWYWKSISSPQPGGGTPEASLIPDWVWADIIGMELGGPVGSAVASAAVYLDQR
ncbi:MAG: hypothetical protein EPGJADBJ_03872 [Saprospiraceae bacterium]|nr:hypothetical protein [Saprospiraceae bacterium]